MVLIWAGGQQGKIPDEHRFRDVLGHIMYLMCTETDVRVSLALFSRSLFFSEPNTSHAHFTASRQSWFMWYR